MLYLQLRAFHAVAVHGGFTAGAKALGIGQPTVTVHIKAIEERFGIQLFVREKRRVMPTSAGQALLAVTNNLFRGEAEARDLLEGLGGLRRGHLNIGAVGPFHVTEMVGEFNARYPDVRISVTMRNSREIQERLLDYRDEVAVLSHSVDDQRVHSVHYASSPIVLFVNLDHPWSKRRSIRLKELEGQKVVFRESGSTTRRAFEHALRLANVNLDPIIEIGSREGVWMTVQNGIGVGFVSEVAFTPHPRLRMLRIADSNVRTHTHIACLAERRRSREIRAFLDTVVDLMQRNGKAQSANLQQQVARDLF
jgi:LysR family transcriptional regulator, low CO2-responsive transcriptional regulator